MLKSIINNNKEFRTLCKKIQEESKKIQEGVKSNGVILDKAFNDEPPQAYP